MTWVDSIGVWRDSSALGNGYAYASGSPIDGCDPSGTACWAYCRAKRWVSEIAYEVAGDPCLDELQEWANPMDSRLGEKMFGGTVLRIGVVLIAFSLGLIGASTVAMMVGIGVFVLLGVIMGIALHCAVYHTWGEGA